ncbi:MAG: hypothetical protein COA32_08970 [Fluviicola sp.]|nr:MAG: hypothetical protein COA32_08970 [Fluviicola sp.]
MKQIIYILFTSVIVGCCQNSKQTKQSNQDESTISPRKNSFDFYSNSVLTVIDAEELCEFNFDFFLPMLNQKLANYGIKLEVETVDNYQSSFEILINEQKVKLYSESELSDGTFWDSGPRNFFRKVNEILEEKDINKKFYLLYTGNDLNALFLTEKQFKTMSKLNEGEAKEIPFLP